jgi:single-strand DNA-binding protein
VVNDLNVVLLTGRLTRDPDLKETRSKQQLCTFSLACNRYFRQETGGEYGQEAHYFDVETWGLLAKQCGEGLVKGRLARVQGRLKQDRWQDGAGMNRSKILIVAERVEWVTPKRKDDEDEPVDAEPAPHELAPELGD